jgi:hypothetical protein
MRNPANVILGGDQFQAGKALQDAVIEKVDQ